MTFKFVAGLVLVVVIAGGGYVAWQYHSSRSELANLAPDAKLSDGQVSELVARISKFLVVPADEKPSVVVIKDAAQLATQQSFYKGAQDGDILVVYSSRAIIYDAKNNKLVNVGPIIRNDNPPVSPAPASGSAQFSPSPSVSASPAVTPKAITVDVLNGTATAGLAGATASDLKKNKLFTIGKLGDAKGSFKATVVVDLSKDPAKSAAVALLAKQLNVSVTTSIPAGEASTTADALVIVGK